MRHLLLLLALPVFAPWHRLLDKPILSPQGNGFESAGVFNPAVVKHNGEFVMLYRAQDKNGTSTLGYASSRDGITFTRRPEPVLSPEMPYEANGGVEDPRLVNIDGLYWLTYTGYNKKDAQLCLATSRDLIHWDRKGVILPAYKGRWNVGWTKSGAIIDHKIGGKYWMYFLADAKSLGSQMGVAWSEDLIHWTEPLDHPVVSSRPGAFDAKVVEPGPPPVLTSKGILLIYNGADKDLIYRTGWLLFDPNDPAKVIGRSSKPLFAPGTAWEKVGQVPNVVFVEGLVAEPARWLLYYGAADQYVGVLQGSAPKF